MLEGLIAKLALGTLWSRVKTNATHDWQAISPKARLWILGIAAVLILGTVHQIYAHHVLKEVKTVAYKAGYAQAIKDIEAKAAKQNAALKQIKTTGDAKNAAINQGVKKNHDAQDAHISGNLADLLGVLGRTQGGARGDAGRGVPDAAGRAGAGRTAAPADDGLAQEPATQGAAAGDDVLIAVPAKQLYIRAAQCDRDYVALTSWEDAYKRWAQTYADWQAKTKKVAAPIH